MHWKPSLIRHYHIQTQFLHFELVLKPVWSSLFLHVFGVSFLAGSSCNPPGLDMLNAEAVFHGM
jgi:hypothetical protein